MKNFRLPTLFSVILAVFIIVGFADYGSCSIYSYVEVSVDAIPDGFEYPSEQLAYSFNSTPIEVSLDSSSDFQLDERDFSGYVMAKAKSEYGRLGVYTSASDGSPAEYNFNKNYFYPNAFARASFKDNFKLEAPLNQTYDVRINMKLDGVQDNSEFGENWLKLKVFSEVLTGNEYGAVYSSDNIGAVHDISFELDNVPTNTDVDLNFYLEASTYIRGENDFYNTLTFDLSKPYEIINVPSGTDLSELSMISANNSMRVVPIPSAVWLLGCGLVGLVGFRRKIKN